MSSELRELIYMVAYGFTLIGAGLFILVFLNSIGEPPSDLDNTGLFMGSVPYAIGAPTLGILLIKRAGRSRITRFVGWLALLTGILPLAWLGLFLGFIAWTELFG